MGTSRGYRVRLTPANPAARSGGLSGCQPPPREEFAMTGLIDGFPMDGVITVNRVLLKPEFSVDDLEERVAVLCENVKTYHSETGFIGGFVALNSGEVSNEGSTIGQAVESELKGREALIVTFW